MLGKANIHKLAVSAMMLALALVLPFLTGQIPQVGKMLCPMHFPVLLCGFFCGPWLGAAVGFCAPLLRSFIFGVPHLVPDAVAMCFELAVYGAMAGLLYSRLPRRRIFVFSFVVTPNLSVTYFLSIITSVIGLVPSAL